MLDAIRQAVETGKLKEIEGLTQQALDAGESPQAILDAMTESMGVIGDRFQQGELFVPEMMISAKTMQKSMALLRPLLVHGDAHKYGKCVIGTVLGDLHDIGKNLVALMLESAGFEIIDLGVGVAPEKFVAVLQENPDCELLGLSALLTTAMESMRRTVQAVEAAGLRPRVKILCGGAPVTAAFAERIGADAYAPDAGSAVTAAKDLISR